MPRVRWETLLKQVRELRTKSNGTFFDRVVLLVQIWNDIDFRAAHGDAPDKYEEKLTEEIGDYNIAFYEARAMLEAYPRRDQWEKGNLREMLLTTIEQQRQRQRERADESVAHNRRSAKVKDLEAKDKELERKDETIARLGDEKNSLLDENRRLREELAQTKDKLARAEGALEALQRRLAA